ncbi:1,2-phenylacetyl-CoA epoxidase subunit PaaC [Nocardioides donggukensis]|uniref:Phenylacetate-CoA oxygenase subunit PaaC n=1 Tax=Nocardioides donggukensis TaxID=2774019 RepID=A0A927K3H4_9ACTN|nr:1,2-phenylacetyl-CoA epoxidase subunit PaaC [Nocardioides donggukensis]MBD8869106.1 phenylacetate-CoA oxygenase subunit PaaC [Nocardioides donggukensis]
MSAHVDYLLGLADDALVSSQRMGWWISRSPQLEEDVAMANIGLDQLGQARALLTHAGAVEAAGRDEDDLAYFRDERDFRNVCLVERPMEDFGVAMARLLVFATWQHELYGALSASTDATLAAVAAKARKETAYHVDHARQWTLRLGDGTAESHDRMQAAVEAEWPWREELYDAGTLAPELVERGIAVDPGTLREPVEARLDAVLAEATLSRPDVAAAYSRGRQGRHTEAMGYLLAEMQHLARSHPGVTW